MRAKRRSLKFILHKFLIRHTIKTCKCTVEPRLLDTPEMRPSTIMWTLHSVWNAISIDLHIIRTPEMRTPRYSVKRTLGLAPTVSPPIQTHPYSGHFDEKSVDSLVKQTARRAKA